MSLLIRSDSNTSSTSFSPQSVSPTLTPRATDYTTWLELENFRNGIQPRSSNPQATYTEFPEMYRPGAAPYEIPAYTVARQMCKVFASHKAALDLVARYLPSADTVVFPVHPVNLSNPSIPHIHEVTSYPLLSSIQVRPTSSTRTVFVLDEALTPHCLKPHTDLTITRWRRHMEARKVAHAVAVTKIFENAKVFSEYPKVAFYPESIGVVYGGQDSKDWGFIIRQMQSYPPRSESVQMTPLCSLYIGDSENAPILLDLIAKSGMNPREYILKELLLPILEGWAKIYLETGVLLEPHGQNVIVEIDSATQKIQRFAHRDFDCEVNQDIAQSANISLEDLNVRDLFTTDGDAETPKGSRLSIIYDNSIKVPFNAIADLATSHYGISKEDLRQECVQFLRSNFPELTSHFPPNGIAYQYSKDTNNNKCVIEKADPELWR